MRAVPRPRLAWIVAAALAVAWSAPVRPSGARTLAWRAVGACGASAAPAIEDPCLDLATGGAGHAAAGGAPAHPGCATRAMDAFYEELDDVRRGRAGAMARVVQVGDSITASDWIPARARARLGARFADGGAGFVYAAAPTRWYRRGGIVVRGGGWRTRSIVAPGGPDRLLGLGGAAFDAGAGGRARTTFATTAPGSPGDRASRLEVHYLARPGGGLLAVWLDGALAAQVSTAAATPRPAVLRLDAADGPHTLEVAAAGGGSVRVFGAVLERGAPGVVWDNLGLVSSSAPALARVPAAHWREALRLRDPRLVVVFLGANDVEAIAGAPRPGRALTRWTEAFEGLLASARRAGPRTSCLVVSALDRGRGAVAARVPALVEAQRRAARAAGCAFLDAHAWMGGPGSALAWRRRGLLAADLTHPTRRGAERLADALIDALLAGHAAHGARARGRVGACDAAVEATPQPAPAGGTARGVARGPTRCPPRRPGGSAFSDPIEVPGTRPDHAAAARGAEVDRGGPRRQPGGRREASRRPSII